MYMLFFDDSCFIRSMAFTTMSKLIGETLSVSTGGYPHNAHSWRQQKSYIFLRSLLYSPFYCQQILFDSIASVELKDCDVHFSSFDQGSSFFQKMPFSLSSDH